MSTNKDVVWVIEQKSSEGYVPIGYGPTRQQTRLVQRVLFSPLQSRIRKYVPASV
jgi:hypothetical protein